LKQAKRGDQMPRDIDMTEEAQEQRMDPVQLLMAIAAHPNIATELASQELARIAIDALDGYRLDKNSMSDWRDRMERGVNLATLTKKDKDYPFPNAANVKYPMITTAALQFNARAYPAIVAPDQMVKVKKYGQDPSGAKAARGERVSDHMSWQLASEVEEWESETDKMLVQLPIVGTMVRKVWHDPVEGRSRCRVIDPGALIVNDKVKSLTDAPRASEEISLYPYEIKSRILTGQFAQGDYTGEDEDTQAPEEFIEQHCRIDLDEDGYEEPYIVTVHKRSQTVARIVADFEAEDVTLGPQGVVSIKRGSYFIDYHFLPSMDGGFWGTGLGLLLGDISETINSIINMMLDAGHMSSLGGGFIGKDFRIKGGSNRFKPGEWKTPAASGADIRNSIVPMTFPGPDGTLFQLLGLLVDAAKEVASVKDIMTGDTGTKNMTATTTIALIEQGMMVFTAAYKRIFRSLKKEFKLFAKLNARHLSAEQYSAFHDLTDENGQPVMLDPRADYGAADLDIEPVADPRSVTRMQEAAKAEFVMGLAAQGLVDPQEATQRVLAAVGVGDTDDLMPKPDPMAQQMAMMQAQLAETDLMLRRIEVEQRLADIEETRSKAMKNLSDAEAKEAGVQLDEAKMKLEALRVGIDAALKGRSGPVETAPGYAGNSPAFAPVSEGAGASLQDSLLLGQPVAGTEPAGVGGLGGVGGGRF
jgi:chaperonin GroES